MNSNNALFQYNIIQLVLNDHKLPIERQIVDIGCFQYRLGSRFHYMALGIPTSY